MIKKILIGIIVLAIAGFIALHIFIKNFDVERYRPMVISELEKSLGRPVKLERINLSVKGGALVLELQNLAILESDASNAEPVFESESVAALIQLMPLLRKQLRITSFSLYEPNIRIKRDAHGNINLIGAAPLAAPVLATQDAGLQKSSPLELHVSSLDIHNGHFQFIDETVDPPTKLDAKSLSLNVKDMSPGEPMDVAILTAITLEADRIKYQGNLSLKAQVQMPGGVGVVASGTSWKVHSLDLSEGNLHWINTATKPPMETIITKLRIQGKHLTSELPIDLTITGSLTESEPNFEIKIKAVIPTKATAGSVEKFELTLVEVPLDRLLPPAPQDGISLSGILSAEIDVVVPTLDTAGIIQASSGKGTIKIDQLVVHNLNMLHEAFSKLSMIPGLLPRLNSRLPEDYKAKLEAKDTLFNPIEISAVMERGILKSDAINVSTESLELSMAGIIGLNGIVDMQGSISIDTVLSDAMIRSVSELRGLANQQGRLQFPIAITGTAPNVEVIPDLNYIASKVVASAAINLISQFLNPDEQSEIPQEVPLAPDASSAPPAAAQGDVFGDLIRRLIEKNLPDGAQHE